MNRLHGIIFAFMFDLMNPLRQRINFTRSVSDHRAILPTSLPKFIHHLHIFFGRVISFRMGQLRWQAAGPRRAVEITGHNIPTEPTLR